MDDEADEGGASSPVGERPEQAQSCHEADRQRRSMRRVGYGLLFLFSAATWVAIIWLLLVWL
jgi:hypothetical protein